MHVATASTQSGVTMDPGLSCGWPRPRYSPGGRAASHKLIMMIVRGQPMTEDYIALGAGISYYDFEIDTSVTRFFLPPSLPRPGSPS